MPDWQKLYHDALLARDDWEEAYNDVQLGLRLRNLDPETIQNEGRNYRQTHSDELDR